MKKRVLGILAAFAAGFVALTSCQDEKPFSVYQIGVVYPALNENILLSQEQIEALPSTEKDMFRVAIYLNQWFFKNNFIRTGAGGNPILIEGADEAENDRQAIVIYDNNLSELQKKLQDKSFDEIIREAQLTNGTNGEPELTVTTTGSLVFSYVMKKGSNTQTTIRSTSFTVNYEPLGTPSEPQEPEL